MQRQDDNRDLLNHLSELIENNPDMRFSQILLAFGFVIIDEEVSSQEKLVWKDEFNTEPSVVLNRVVKSRKKFGK